MATAPAVPAPNELPFVRVQPVDPSLDVESDALTWPLVDTAHRVRLDGHSADAYHPAYYVVLADLDGRNTRRAIIHCCSLASLLRSRHPAIDAFPEVIARHDRYWYAPASLGECCIL